MTPPTASLSFHALVIETTDRCNARCGMCYQAAGPRGSDLRGDNTLDLATVKRIIAEAAELDEVASRLHISGGEAFLNYRDTVEAFRYAKAIGYHNIGSTTNGFWATTRDIALARCIELREVGVDYLEVSFDHWHLPHVAPARVKNLLWATRRAGINVILRTLTSRSHHLDDVLGYFSDDDLLGVVIGNGRVHPVGRGATEVPADDVYYGSGPVGACEPFLNLTISPNGNVYPCCAGADMTESMSSGNVRRESLGRALQKLRTDRMIRHVIHAGAGTLVPIVNELGFGDRLQPAYNSICHLCWDVFRDNELAAALRGYFAEQQIQEMLQLLAAPLAEQDIFTPQGPPAGEAASLPTPAT
jgi:MoaA/NifB/PqqE/SkfB family radical SAM enzyme